MKFKEMAYSEKIKDYFQKKKKKNINFMKQYKLS